MKLLHRKDYKKKNQQKIMHINFKSKTRRIYERFILIISTFYLKEKFDATTHIK